MNFSTTNHNSSCHGKPNISQNNNLRKHQLLLTLMLLLLVSFISVQSYSQGTWQAVATPAPHQNVGGFIVLSDGSVLCKSASGGTPAGDGNLWDKLTPNILGSYVNGTWSTIAAMQRTRVFFSSQMLMDGRVYVAGGEYGTDGTQAGAHGEVYNPLTNTWLQCPAPGIIISDANSEILPNGTILQAAVNQSQPTAMLIYNPTSNTYTAGPSAIHGHNESAWVKLADNSILYVDESAQTSERFIPSLNQWVADGNIPVALYQNNTAEMGPGFLLPDGRAFFIGGTPHTAYYTPSGNSSPGTWTAGPDVPNGYVMDDAPGAMMVNGNILIAVDVPVETAPTRFYEFNYLTNTFTQVGAPGGGTSLAGISTFQTTMVCLPNGQVLFGIGQAGTASSTYYVYTPNGSPLTAGKPTVASITQTNCNAFSITGTLFNGISEGAGYGDDFQMATNYPIVRLSNGGNVYYARTFNWNSTGVMRGSAPDTTQFTLPAGLPHAVYYLKVVANGIASDSVQFIPFPLLSSTTTPPSVCSGTAFTYTPTSLNAGTTFAWTRAAVTGISNAAVTTPQATNPNEVLINTTANPVSVVYLYRLTVNNCTDSATVTVVVNPSPTASITGTNTICQGVNTSLTATGGGTYLWNTGATTSGITVTPASTTTYTITITSGNGCTGSASRTVTVNASPTATISANGNTTFCQGGSVILTSSAGASYLWSNAATTQSITVTTSGNYSVSVTNANGCSAASSSTTVTVNTLPTATISANGNTTFCQGNSVILTSSAGASYLWSNAATTQSITVTTSGNYSVTVTNANGCSAASSSTTVTVNALPTAIISANGNTTFCQGGSVILTSSAGASYLWSNGSTSQTITVTTSGNYSVTVTNVNGCSAASSSTTVNVNTLPTAIISANGNTTFCQGNSVILTSSAGASYLWSNAATTQSITVTTSGNYSVIVTNANGCSAASSSSTVTVNALPTAIISANGNTTFCQGNSVVLTSSAGASYLWSNAATAQSITVTTSGNYSVTVTNANGCSSSSNSITVTVNTTTTASITANGNTTFCQGGSVILTSSAGASYLWSNAATSQSITVTTSGNYSVTMTNASGCTGIASQSVTVNPSASPAITGPSAICNGAAITLSAGSFALYIWSNAATTSSITITAAGTYRVTVTNANGCTGTASRVITAATGSTPVITASGPISFCPGGSVTLSTTAFPAYIWSNGSTTSSIIVSTAATYKVTVTNASGCTGSASKVVTVYAAPVPMITITNMNTFCTGGSATLTVSAIFASYLWNTGATTRPINVSTSGTFTVTVTNTNGCTGSVSTVMNNSCNAPTSLTTTAITGTSATTNWVQPICYYGYSIQRSIHNANVWTTFVITPNTHYTFSGLALNTTYDWQIRTNCNAAQTNVSAWSPITTFTTLPARDGGEMDNNYSFQVIPNPASNQTSVTFMSDNEENYSVKLIDLSGRIIHTEMSHATIGENQMMMDISQVSKGIYFVILQKGDAVLNTKLVIE